MSAVITRSFALDGLRFMLPLADLFNHRPCRVPRVAWALHGDSFQVRALEDVAVGQEVRLCYGEESAAELLAVHGVVLSENEADYLELFESGEELQESTLIALNLWKGMENAWEINEHQLKLNENQ